MAKFRFQLEPVLNARKLNEQAKQRIVAAIERERREMEDALRQQQARIAEAKCELASHLTGAIDAQVLRAHAAASMQQMRDAQRMVLKLAGLHRRLENARAELINAARQRRAIELLKEKRFEEWNVQQNRAEVAALDEMAVIAAARRSKSDQLRDLA